jgi:hypothetical protein
MSDLLSVEGAQQGSSFFSVVAVPMAKFSADSAMGSRATGSLALWVKS